MKLADAIDVLEQAVQLVGIGGRAENLIAAGWLVEQGYVTAIDDYEGPRIFPTAKGQRAVIRRSRDAQAKKAAR